MHKAMSFPDLLTWLLLKSVFKNGNKYIIIADWLSRFLRLARQKKTQLASPFRNNCLESSRDSSILPKINTSIISPTAQAAKIRRQGKTIEPSQSAANASSSSMDLASNAFHCYCLYGNGAIT